VFRCGLADGSLSVAAFAPQPNGELDALLGEARFDGAGRAPRAFWMRLRSLGTRSRRA
jgi:hypothetical protein